MNLDFAFYRKLLLRRLPVMVLFLLVCSSLGIITALNLPQTWYTSARLLVEAPQIPDTMVTSMVQTEATEQLEIIEQRLLTRANLIDIANRYEVFTDIREIEPDVVVERMREATRIRRSAGRNEATLMSIGFEARSPRIAADVVNEYVTLVLRENAAFRMSRAENTLEFFEQEVTRLGEELDRKSIDIAQFRSENADALPEEQEYRFERLSVLQERLAQRERELLAERQRRKDLVRNFELTGRISANREEARQSPEERQLSDARARLEQARAVYSESHPLLRQLSAQVERLEAVVAGQMSADADARSAEGARETVPERALMESMLAEIDSRIGILEEEIAGISTNMDVLEEAIARSSTNGIALAALERDYMVIQTRYDAAVANLNQARMSERIEATAQGQRIAVIENASVPQVPFGPNRVKIVLMGIAAGLGLAGGYFVLLELLNRTVRRPSELADRFNIVPIATIPYLESRRQKTIRRASLIGATLAVIVTVPAVLWYVDTNYLPLDILMQRGLAKLGLS